MKMVNCNSSSRVCQEESGIKNCIAVDKEKTTKKCTLTNNEEILPKVIIYDIIIVKYNVNWNKHVNLRIQ
jgi:hypothetical protein